MKALRILTFSACVGASALMISGCTTAQKGAAGMGLVGGIAGSVVGNNWSSAGPATGAAVGAGSGAAVGGLAGDAYDEITDKDASRELENLRAELAAKEAEIAGLRDRAPSEEQLAEVDDLKGRISKLEAELGEAWTTADQEAMERQAAEQQLAELAQEKGQLATQVNELKSEKTTLQDQLDQLRDQKSALEESLNQAQQEADDLRTLLDEKEETLAQTSQERTQLAQDLATLEQEIASKEGQLAELENQVGVLRTSLNSKEEAVEELRGELDQLNIKLEETSRGLTMTIVNSLIFEPGRAELSTEGNELIGNVAGIIKERFPNRELLIEGHTDNQPIVHSGWRSNWELGAARALNILHELTGEHGIDPALVSATSYGETRPTTTNATEEGRAQNRRAVIVILPEKLPMQRSSLAQAE